MEETAQVILGGDAMLGRIVKERIRRHGARYPLGAIAEILRRADLTVVNLECAITSSQALWAGEPKAFYFGAPPEAIQALVSAEVDLVSLANNHTLDYGVDGLSDTIRLLHEHGIMYAGAGANVMQARTPALLERKGILFGVVAYCDHQEDFAATSDRAGIAYLDLRDEERALARVREDLERLRESGVEWPILSMHWGPNMVDRPSDRLVRFAHAAIEAGYGMLYGHSAHVCHGIELYKGRPIIYSAGDLVDDYAIDDEFRNDRQVLFELKLTRSRVHSIDLLPIVIDDCRAIPAPDDERREIIRRMTALCADMGTAVHQEGERVWINGQ